MIFISHSSKDKPLADALVNLLTGEFSLGPKDIMSTSTEGVGIPLGADWEQQLKKKLLEASYVIFLITPEFVNSQFCSIELGAIWITNSDKILGLRLNTEIQQKITLVLEKKQLGNIETDSGLDDLRDTLISTFTSANNSSKWTRLKKDLIARAEEHKKLFYNKILIKPQPPILNPPPLSPPSLKRILLIITLLLVGIVISFMVGKMLKECPSDNKNLVEALAQYGNIDLKLRMENPNGTGFQYPANNLYEMNKYIKSIETFQFDPLNIYKKKLTIILSLPLGYDATRKLSLLINKVTIDRTIVSGGRGAEISDKWAQNGTEGDFYIFNYTGEPLKSSQNNLPITLILQQ
jgi:hypothetical protein